MPAKKQAKRPADAADVKAHLAAIDGERGEIMRSLHTVVREAAPELTTKMWNDTIIGYGTLHYRGASGREGDRFPVGLANQKQYVSLYLCAADDRGYLAEQNADRFQRPDARATVSVGKSCVRFKHLDDLDLDVVRELVRRTADLADAGGFAL
jgi:hypothetical protein